MTQGNADEVAPASGAGVIAIVRMTARPGHNAAVLRLLGEAAATVRATEPGCSYYAVAQNSEEPVTFVVVQVFASAEALETHRRSPIAQTIVPELMGLLAEPPRAELYDVRHGA